MSKEDKEDLIVQKMQQVFKVKMVFTTIIQKFVNFWDYKKKN